MTSSRIENLGELARALRAAGVLDHEAVDLPGSVVLLPHGLRLAERFGVIVRERLRMLGLEEHEYPMLVPPSCFGPAAGLFSYENALLHVGTDADFARGEPRATLCPTGEAEIYTHWSRRVRRREDLPIRMFRCARYFRPAAGGHHSGRSIFRQAEAAEVFELHCAFADAEEQAQALADCAEAFRAIAAALHVPMLWSERPREGNHERIARRAFAGDVALPTGGTVQVATLYDQGEAFSSAYRVGWRSGGQFHPAQQLAGAITRRLLFVHLALGLESFGVPAPHPVLAPEQVVIVQRGNGSGDDEYVDALCDGLRRGDRRVAVVRGAGRREVARAQRSLRTRGTPLELLYFGPREEGDEVRVVLRTADGEEESATGIGPGQAVEKAAAALQRYGRLWSERAAAACEERCVPAGSMDDLRRLVDGRLVAMVPAERGASLPRAVAATGGGEVLGFLDNGAASPSILTGTSTTERALVSARI
jgi:hypothetical protein